MTALKQLYFAALISAGLAGNAAATPLTGDATLYSGGPQFSIPITGDLDIASRAMSVDDFQFFGKPLVTSSVELLDPGTYTRTDNFGGTTTATVAPGQLGAWVVMDWAANNGLGTFMVWNVNQTAAGASYMAIDSDGDGDPGHTFVAGLFNGGTLFYEFTVGDPPPSVEVVIGAAGGTVQECAQTGGSETSLSATVTLAGGAILGSIEWSVNGESAGNGADISAFLALGTNTIDVTATATTGESGSDSINITIQDTLAPDLELGFLDRNGNLISSTAPGARVVTRLESNDVCDPEPSTTGSVVPVFEVGNGDVVRIKANRTHAVKLPTTAVELTGTTTDASGNSSTGTAVLSISE